jgi:hypothetical protein
VTVNSDAATGLPALQIEMLDQTSPEALLPVGP